MPGTVIFLVWLLFGGIFYRARRQRRSEINDCRDGPSIEGLLAAAQREAAAEASKQTVQELMQVERETSRFRRQKFLQ